MKQVSSKQALRNRELAKIKVDLPKTCFYCGQHGNELMHILPKSLFPEYYTKRENLTIGCHEHHVLFDDKIDFRKKQSKLIRQVRVFATKEEIFRYFQL